jgi:hypothetical protein
LRYSLAARSATVDLSGRFFQAIRRRESHRRPWASRQTVTSGRRRSHLPGLPDLGLHGSRPSRPGRADFGWPLGQQIALARHSMKGLTIGYPGTRNRQDLVEYRGWTG